MRPAGADLHEVIPVRVIVVRERVWAAEVQFLDVERLGWQHVAPREQHWLVQQMVARAHDCMRRAVRHVHGLDVQRCRYEVLTWIDLPASWYAMKRHADFSPTGSKGEKTHISFALRVDAVPAFVTVPDGSTLVSDVRSYKQEAVAAQTQPAAPASMLTRSTPN